MTRHPYLAKWFTGAPPAIGWWNASVSRQVYVWRWWNGEYWSIACYDDATAEDVIANSQVPDELQEKICWSNYWPDYAISPVPVVELPVDRDAPAVEDDFDEVGLLNKIKIWLLVAMGVLLVAIICAVAIERKNEMNAAKSLIAVNMHFERELKIK